MSKYSTVVLLLNTGSPDSPHPWDVGRYLSRFLGDQRIISLPYLFRKLLVNCIIVPFRCFHSGARYQKLWNHYGEKFPLPYFGTTVQRRLQEKLQDKAAVFIGMRYGKPSIENQVKTIIKAGCSKVILIPLFPQYASSSAGSVLECALNALKCHTMIPEIHTVGSFYDHPLFIKAFAEKIKTANYKEYDRILFTYHGLPLNHVRKVAGTAFDYESACGCTTKLIAKELNLPADRFELAFQSRMSGKWLAPFADEVILKNAKEGIKSLLVVAPSFVADCLETTIELGEEYKQLFLKNGGVRYNLVESLNDSFLWISCLESIIGLESK